MAKKLYVGNLPWSVTSIDLDSIVNRLGLVVARCEIVYDRETDRSRGFAFLHFDTDEQGRAAMTALNGLDVKGRVLVVNEATSRQQDRGKPSQRGGGGDYRREGGRSPGSGRGRKPRSFRNEDYGNGS